MFKSYKNITLIVLTLLLLLLLLSFCSRSKHVDPIINRIETKNINLIKKTDSIATINKTIKNGVLKLKKKTIQPRNRIKHIDSIINNTVNKDTLLAQHVIKDTIQNTLINQQDSIITKQDTIISNDSIIIDSFKEVIKNDKTVIKQQKKAIRKLKIQKALLITTSIVIPVVIVILIL